MSFCREATLRWSPRWEARKIRCRRLRTRRSARRQSTVFQSVCAVAPLTVSVPNFHLGQQSSHRPSDDPPDPRQPSFDVGLSARAALSSRLGERAPVSDAFRRLAFASRILLLPLGNSAFLTVGLLAAEPPSGFPRSA